MQKWTLAKLQAILTPLQILHFFHVYIVLGASGGVIRQVDSCKVFGKHKTTFNKYNRIIASFNLWQIERDGQDEDQDNLNQVIFLLKEQELIDVLFELFEIGEFLKSSYIDYDNQFDHNYIFQLKSKHQSKLGKV